MEKIITAHDRRKAKAAAEVVTEPTPEQIQDAANREFAAQHPQIGELIRNGRPVFYITAPAYYEDADPRGLLALIFPEVGDRVRGIWGAMHAEWQGEIVGFQLNGDALVKWDEECVNYSEPRAYVIRRKRTGNGSSVGVWLEREKAWR